MWHYNVWKHPHRWCYLHMSSHNKDINILILALPNWGSGEHYYYFYVCVWGGGGLRFSLMLKLLCFALATWTHPLSFLSWQVLYSPCMQPVMWRPGEDDIMCLIDRTICPPFCFAQKMTHPLEFHAKFNAPSSISSGNIYVWPTTSSGFCIGRLTTKNMFRLPLLRCQRYIHLPPPLNLNK